MDESQIKWRLRRLFEKNRSLTGTHRTIKVLKMGYKVRAFAIFFPDSAERLVQWLDTFKRARDGDKHLQAVLQRYSRMIAAKREKENWKQVMREEWVRSVLLPQPALLRELTTSIVGLANAPATKTYPHRQPARPNFG